MSAVWHGKPWIVIIVIISTLHLISMQRQCIPTTEDDSSAVFRRTLPNQTTIWRCYVVPVGKLWPKLRYFRCTKQWPCSCSCRSYLFLTQPPCSPSPWNRCLMCISTSTIAYTHFPHSAHLDSHLFLNGFHKSNITNWYNIKYLHEVIRIKTVIGNWSEIPIQQCYSWFMLFFCLNFTFCLAVRHNGQLGRMVMFNPSGQEKYQKI